MRMNKMMRVGIAVTSLAWILLLWAIISPGPLLRLIGDSGPALGQHYLVTLFQSLLFTGFFVIVVAVLIEGFSALNRFFDTIARRTGGKSEAHQPARAASDQKPQQKAAAASAATPAPQAAAQQQAQKPVQKPALKQGPSAPPKIMDEGILRGRAYALYTDGSVEVDTLLGRKRFDTMEAAIAYLGVGGNLLHRAA